MTDHSISEKIEYNVHKIKKNCHKTGNGFFLFVTVLFMILLLNQHSIAKAKETISFFYSDLIRMKHMLPSCECRYKHHKR